MDLISDMKAKGVQ